MNRNKYGILALVIIAAAAIHYFFFYEKCQQPEPVDIAVAQLLCAQNIDLASLKVEVCQAIYSKPECELQEIDRDTVIGIFMKKINDCAKSSLKEENKCIDKYEDLQ